MGANKEIATLANKGHTDWITASVLLSQLASELAAKHGGISMTQYRILIRLIMGKKDGMRVTEIAKKLGIDASTATNAINNLEAKHAVKRTYDSADKRVVHVVITDEGAKLVRSIDPAITELAHDFWSDYTQEELEMTFKDSQSTAVNFNLEYVSDDSMSVENAYVDSSWVIVTELGRHMRRANISLNEYRLLYLLHENPSGVTPGNAAKILLLRSNEVAVAASKLEEHGRIERVRSSLDRRSNTLFITDKGLDKLKRITPSVIDAMRFNICDLAENAFDLYDSIASKVLKSNRQRRLIL